MPTRSPGTDMNNVQQAIRDAAEKGGYRYRWWKVKDLEHTKGTTGCNCALYQSTSTTLISGKHSVRLGTGRMQMPGVGIGIASSTISPKRKRVFSPLYNNAYKSWIWGP